MEDLYDRQHECEADLAAHADLPPAAAGGAEEGGRMGITVPDSAPEVARCSIPAPCPRSSR